MCVRTVEIMDKKSCLDFFFPFKKESCNCTAWENHSKGLGNSADFLHLMVVMFAPSVSDF